MSEFRSDLNLNRVYNQLSNSTSDYTVGHTIDYHKSVPSTMPIAHKLAQSARCQSGTVVIAEEQTVGRGRLQRRWDAPYGQGLLISVIIKPPYLPTLPAQLPMIAGVALAKAIELEASSLMGQVQLKWPNDVLITKAQRIYKVAGILIETSYRGGMMDYAIMGMGTNVNQNQEALPTLLNQSLEPTSIRCMNRGLIDRTALLITLCRQLSHWLSSIAESNSITSDQNDCNKIYTEWRERLHTLGQQVVIYQNQGNHQNDRGYRGIVRDIRPSGELLIENDEGECRTFAFGDVTVRQPHQIQASQIQTGQAQPENQLKDTLA